MPPCEWPTSETLRAPVAASTRSTKSRSCGGRAARSGRCPVPVVEREDAVAVLLQPRRDQVPRDRHVAERAVHQHDRVGVRRGRVAAPVVGARRADAGRDVGRLGGGREPRRRASAPARRRLPGPSCAGTYPLERRSTHVRVRAHEVGDQVDRARSRAPRRPARPARARAPARRAGRRPPPTGGPPSFSARIRACPATASAGWPSACRPPGPRAAAARAACRRRPCPRARRSPPRAGGARRTRRRATRPARARRPGCGRRRRRSAGRSSTTSMRPADRRSRRPRPPTASERSSPAPEEGLGRGQRRARSSAAGSRPGRAAARRRRAGARDQRGVALGGDALRDRRGRPGRAARRRASRGRARRRASPPRCRRPSGPSQRVCSRPDDGEHLDLRRDHVGRVVAPAEPGLDHRDLHPAPGQLVVGGGGERLELRHAVVRRPRCG